MKIDNVNNTTFGIRCIKPESWDKKVYNTLINSKVSKVIDKKYPNASANYFLFKDNDTDNVKPFYTLLFDLNLTKGKIWHFWIKSPLQDILPETLSKNLKDLTIEKIEADISNSLKNSNIVTIDMKPAKENPIKKFFKKNI